MGRMIRQLNEHAVCENPECGKEFPQRTWWQKYCSGQCGGRVRFDRYLDKMIEQSKEKEISNDRKS